MGSRISWTILAVALAVAACGRHQAPAKDDGAQNGAATAMPAPAAAAPVSAPTPARAATLTDKGIAPGLTFGMPRDDALVAAQAAFGASTSKERNEECGGGPMDLVGFHDLQLVFQDNRLAGWALSGATPALRNAGGLAVGAPRSVLGDADVDEEGTLGPEFEVAGIGGILDKNEEKVEALWAGLTCQFR